MTFNQLINDLVRETTQKSLLLFSPELALCATIVLLLLIRLFGVDRWVSTYWFALFGAIAAFGLAWLQFANLMQDSPIIEMAGIEQGMSEPFFTGMLIFDKFTVFFRLFLLLFLILIIALTVLSGIPDNEDGPDFYTLLLGSTVGMMMMAGANHLLMVFLAVEMTSVPSYVMVGFMKGRRLSSEAALKYVVYGAGAAGVMLYGISLIAGLLQTGDLSQIAAGMQETLSGQSDEVLQMSDATTRTLVLATMMVLVGIAFKLSAVPFHFWCPDAFEGAPAEVGGFLSVASKGAAFGLLLRFVLSLVHLDDANLGAVYLYLGIGLGVIAAVTATFGNLAAYAQTNIKRMLAYSTIAHAGYMLMAVAALLVVLGQGTADGASAEQVHSTATRCIEGLLYYLVVYLFMNLGAFAIVALIRNEIYSEEIEDYAGLVRQTPILCVCMLICMFSLIGIPPLGGFFGKWIIFYSLFEAGEAHPFMWVVLGIGGLNTVFSLIYYLNVLKTMFITPRPEGARRVDLPFWPIGGYVLLVSLPVLALGIWVDQLSATAQNVAAVFFQ